MPDAVAELRAALDAALAEVADLRRKLDSLARLDPLTGLSNRRHLEEHLDMVASGARRLRAPSSLLLVDIDHLRRVNDEHGHAAGDAVLRAVAERLAAGLRGEDMAGRWGDEELLAILPHTPLDGAWRLADRVRQAVSDTPVMLPTGDEIVVTVSVGCAEGRGDDVDDHLRRTDVALAEAKASGRNRVVADTSTAVG